MRLPRGLRNNNPGNLRVNPANNWRGKLTGSAKKDKAFEEFVSMAYGYRALMVNAYTLITRDGYDTIESFIEAWAPPKENDTEAYIRAVCRKLGADRRSKINYQDREYMIALASAISEVENAPYKAVRSDVEAGWEMYRQDRLQ